MVREERHPNHRPPLSLPRQNLAKEPGAAWECELALTGQPGQQGQRVVQEGAVVEAGQRSLPRHLAMVQKACSELLILGRLQLGMSVAVGSGGARPTILAGSLRPSLFFLSLLLGLGLSLRPRQLLPARLWHSARGRGATALEG